MLYPLSALKHHYTERYAPHFRHAKKLFFFDLGLIALTLFLGIATLIYIFYTPTTTTPVLLTISVPNTRVQSGDTVTFTVSANLIDKTYHQTNSPLTLHIDWPESLIVQSGTSPSSSLGDRTLSLDFNTSTTHIETITGTYIGRPGELVPLVAHITHNDNTLQTSARAWLVSRGSTIAGSFQLSDRIPEHGQTPLTITLTNEGKETIRNISLPLTAPAGFTIRDLEPTDGEVRNGVWYINTLAPGNRVTARGTVATTISSAQGQRITFTLTPEITEGAARFLQQPFSTETRVEPVRIQVTSEWPVGTTALSPGDTAMLRLTAEKQTTLPLQHLTVTLTIDPQLVDTIAFVRRYPQSTRTGNTLRVPVSDSIFTTSTSIMIPLRSQTSVSSLTIEGTLNATISPGNSDIHIPFSSRALPVGTSLSMDGQLRYYTSEGDQLGRGPLPPTIGKETSYWVIASIQNGGGVLANPSFTATLLPYTRMGDQVSATEGDTPTFHKDTHTVTWQGRTMQPNTAVDIAFEIIFTPTPDMIGTSPTLLESLTVSGLDRITNKRLEKTIRTNLGISVPLDDRAKAKGTLVLP